MDSGDVEMNWKDLWLKFVKKEYDYCKTKLFCEDKKMILFAVDGGGYDITNEVTLIETEDGVFLEFYDDKKIGKFKVTIGDKNEV